MMKQLYSPLRAFLCLLLLLPACSTDEGGADSPVLPQGDVNVYLAVKPWSQPELAGVYLAVNELMLAGPEGLVNLDKLSTGERVNLLDYQDEPLLLGTQTLAAGPYAAYQVRLGLIPLDQRNYKVPICHRPPGNPNKSRTLYLPACAVPAHTAHGDFIGACTKNHDDDDDDDDNGRSSNGRQQDDDDGKHLKFSMEPDQFSYLTFTEGYSALLFGEQTEFTGLVDFEVIEGATTEVLITIDVEASLSEFPLPQDEQVKKEDDDDDDDDNGRSSNGRQQDDDDDDGKGRGGDDDDDDGGNKRGDDDDDDHASPSVPNCEFLYVFDPVVTVEVIAQEGPVQGVYTGPLGRGRDYTVYIYPGGGYNDTEVSDRRNPFPNALVWMPLDTSGEFHLEALTAGSYDFVVGEFSAGRYRAVVSRNVMQPVAGGEINEITLEKN